MMITFKLFQNVRYMQYLSAIAATLSMASAATYLAWPSPTLVKLESENSPIGITISKEESSWIASSFLLGAIPACIYARWATEKFGPKMSLLFSFVPLFVPWVVIMFAKSVIVICVSRFIAGSAFAIVSTSGSIYAGEIAEKDVRGKLGTMMNILKLTGSLFVLTIGPFVSYMFLAMICSFIPILFGVLFYFMPESPYYLIKIGKKEEAKKNLIRLSNSTREMKDIDEHLKDIEKTVTFDMTNKSTLWELFSGKEYRKSLIVIIGIKMIQQLTGIAAIEAYIQTIIESSGSTISPEVTSIICGVVQLPAAMLAASVVDKLGRKPLLLISTLGCCVALIGETVYFYLQNVAQTDVSFLSWLPTTGLILYLVMNPIGIYTLPYVLLGELFATNIKAVAISTSTTFGVTLGFLVTKFFEPIVVALGIHVVFGLFAIACVLGSLFVFFVQPETKGKSFSEIQLKLNRSKKTKGEVLDTRVCTSPL